MTNQETKAKLVAYLRKRANELLSGGKALHTVADEIEAGQAE